MRRLTVGLAASGVSGRDLLIPSPHAGPLSAIGVAGDRITKSTTCVRSSPRSVRYAPNASILVVDDNSPDVPAGLLGDEMAGTCCPRSTSSTARGCLGSGTAMLAAMQFATDHRYDQLLNLDADFSHPPRVYAISLLVGWQDHDVMIVARVYIKGGGVEGEFNLRRKVMSTGHQSGTPASCLA